MSRPENKETYMSLADTIVWAAQSSGLINYAEAHISGGAETTVDTNLVWHAALGFVVDISSGVTFNAGETGAITAYASAGGGQITVTAGNTLSDGDIVTITGSTNYNGLFEVTNTSGTDFEITHADNGNDGASTYRNGSNFVITVAGVYLYNWQLSASAAAVNTIFTFTVSINDTIITAGLQRRKFAVGGDIGSVSGSFLIDGSVDDIITFNFMNESDATNLTIQQATANIHQIS